MARLTSRMALEARPEIGRQIPRTGFEGYNREAGPGCRQPQARPGTLAGVACILQFVENVMVSLAFQLPRT